MTDKVGALASGTGLSSATPIEPVPVSPLCASIPSAEPSERAINLTNEYLKEKYGLHPDWRWHSMKVLDHKGRDPKDWNFVQYEGGVYPTPISRGPRKGSPNYKKPLDGSERTLVVDESAFRAWVPLWERMTGKCSVCRGTGQKWTGWHYQRGDSFKPCPECNATGKAPNRDRDASLAEKPQALSPEGGAARPEGIAHD